MAEVTTTVKPSGGDYTSLSSWESGEQDDLVTAQDTHVVTCYAMDDEPAGFDLSGWTTNSTYYITIQADSAAKATSVWQATGAYTLAPTAGTFLAYITVDYTRVIGLQIQGTSTAATDLLRGHATGLVFDKCFIRQDADKIAYQCSPTAGVTYGDGGIMFNCIIVNTVTTLSGSIALLDYHNDDSGGIYDSGQFESCSFYCKDATNSVFTSDTGTNAGGFTIFNSVIAVATFGDTFTNDWCAATITGLTGSTRKESVALANLFNDAANLDFTGEFDDTSSSTNFYGWNVGYYEVEDTLRGNYNFDEYSYGDTDINGLTRWDSTEGIWATEVGGPGAAMPAAPSVTSKTVKASAGDYTSLYSWESGEQANLITTHTVAEAVCDPITETTQGELQFAGWGSNQTDRFRRVRIKAAAGNSTSPKFGDTNCYNYKPTVGDGFDCYTDEVSFEFTGVQFRASSGYGGRFGSTTADPFGNSHVILMDKCLFWGTTIGLQLYGHANACLRNSVFVGDGSVGMFGSSTSEELGTDALVLQRFFCCSFVNTDATADAVETNDPDGEWYFQSCLFWTGDMTTYQETNNSGGAYTNTYLCVSEHDGSQAVLSDYDAYPFTNMSTGDFSLAHANGFYQGSDHPDIDGSPYNQRFCGVITEDIYGTSRPATGSNLWTGGAEQKAAPTLTTVTVKSADGDYTSLTAAEAGEQQDSRPLWETIDIVCYPFIDTAGTCTINGWTLSASCRLQIHGSAALSGTPDFSTPGAYVMSYGSGSVPLYCQESYVDVYDLMFLGQASSGTIYGPYFDAPAVDDDDRIDRLIVKIVGTGTAVGGSSSYGCFRADNNTGSTERIVTNCLVWVDVSASSNAFSYKVFLGNTGTNYADTNYYNCGAYVVGDSSGYGFFKSGFSTCKAFNCWVVGITTAGRDFYGLTSATYADYCASDQASGTSALATGVNNVFGLVTTAGTDFEDIANGKFNPALTGALHAAGNDYTSTWEDTTYDLTQTLRTFFDIGPLDNLTQAVTGVICSGDALSIDPSTVEAIYDLTGIIVSGDGLVIDPSAVEAVYYLVALAIACEALAMDPSELTLNDWDTPDNQDDSWSDVDPSDDTWTDVSSSTDSWSDV